MSTDALNWAWKQREVRGSAKLVLVRLADFAGQRGESWPTFERLQADCGIGADAVREALKALVAVGLVYRTARWRSSPAGGRRSSEYVLLFTDEARAYAIDAGWDQSISQVKDEDETEDAEPPATPGTAAEGDPGIPGVASGGQPRESRGGNPGNSGVAYKEEPSIEPSDSPPPPKGGVGSASLFERFKGIWPFDAADLVHPAQRAFARLALPEQELAVKWAKAYLDHAKAQSRKRMTAESWLRKKGWQAFKAQPETAALPQVWIARGTAQWRAWEAWHAAAGDVRMTRDPDGAKRLIAIPSKRGFGRLEPSEWPPSIPPLDLAGGGASARDGPTQGAA
ncbi:helix-turn-helix domain-containing protein [Methylocystis iwaonis]|uniref:helix-turn-helix domain-containing protein n=1 Tax=Methylocystis iwaonis TaxID=2885079 RepID=UPI002E7AFF3C|nr:helix-turn-helix domain-containing protein [Methylocystis iwaonis]